MPGIFGIISADNSLQNFGVETCLNRMTNMLSHQPWYQCKHFSNEQGALGAIAVGSSASLEHVIFRNHEYIVLIDGYVYSIGNLKIDSSVDISLKIVEFLSESSDELHRIRGNYSIAVYNINKKSFFLFNDRMGPRRIYYAQLGSLFIFSPEIKAISCLPQFEKKIDWQGVSDFLNFSYLLGEKTLFKDIRSLASGSCLTFDQNNNTFQIEKYSTPSYQDSTDSFDDIVDKGLSLLRNSVSEKIQQADSIICPISGGLDSRLILSILHQVNNSAPVNPVTYGQKFSYEYKNAVKVCDALGYDNHSLVDIQPDLLLKKYKQAVWLSEGMVPMTNCHLLLLPRALGDGHSTLLNGIYGGPTNYAAEYFRRDHVDCDLNFDNKVEDILKVLSLSPDLYKGILPDLSPNLHEYSFESISAELKNHLGASDRFCDQRDSFFIENRMRRCINQGSLYRFYWQEHLPLSNYDLYDFYLSTPPEMKLERKLLKEMLKKSFPEVSKIKDANTGLNLYKKNNYWNKKRNKINNNIRYYVNKYGKGRIFIYDKTTYSHYDVWFQNHEKTSNCFKELLFNKSITKDEIFNSQELHTLFSRAKERRLGFNHLVRLITFSIWYELFVQNSDIDSLKNELIEKPFN